MVFYPYEFTRMTLAVGNNPNFSRLLRLPNTQANGMSSEMPLPPAQSAQVPAELLAAPVSPAQPPPRKRHGCFYYGCLLSLAAFVLGSVYLGSIFFYARQQLGPTCDTFLHHIDAKEFSQAYAMAGPLWKKTQTQEQFQTFFNAIQKKLGKLKSKSMTGAQYQQMQNSNTLAQVTYNATFEHDSGVIRFTFQKSGGKWQLEGAHYNTPLINQLLVCPWCGAHQTALGKYCATCGKPMTRDSRTSTADNLTTSTGDTTTSIPAEQPDRGRQ